MATQYDLRRHYAVAVDGTKITFECPEGHRYTTDFSKGKVTKRLPAWWCGRMLSYWGRDNGGVKAPRCRRCLKVAP